MLTYYAFLKLVIQLTDNVDFEDLNDKKTFKCVFQRLSVKNLVRK